MKIFVYGDSFSIDNDLSLTNELPVKYFIDLASKGLPFIEWTGLLRMAGHEVINRAINGNDNQNIFESVLEDYNLFEDNNMIIIGWSSIDRLRLYTTFREHGVPSKPYSDKFMSLTNSKDIWKKLEDDEILSKFKLTLQEMLFYKVSSPNSHLEILNWMNIINNIYSPKLKIVHWFWNPKQFYGDYNQNMWLSRYKEVEGFIDLHFDKDSLWEKYQPNGIYNDLDELCSYKSSIYKSSDGKYVDCHWDEEGHKVFYNIILDIIKEHEKIVGLRGL